MAWKVLGEAALPALLFCGALPFASSESGPGKG